MDLIREFQSPDRDYSLLAFWFLNGELKEERLRWQIAQMTKKGVYGGFMHPRAYLKTPYLEKEWWDAIDICVDEADKQGFHPWLYDEYAWPSGTAGSTFEYGFQKPSRVLAMGPANMAKGLYAKVFDCKSEALEAVPEHEEDQLLQVSERGGRYYVFYLHIFTKAVDYLNPDTIKEFIRLTHEEYKKRYGKDFGRLIPGIFFDEIYMMGNPIPWTENLPKRFKERWGYDLMEALPCLIDGTGDREMQVRKDYYSLIGSMYEEAFFKQISEWCGENNLKLTGHTEEFLWEHPRRQGDYFKTMRHLMIPGADCHDYRYRYPRHITYCEPKYAVSVARAYGKERAMSEAMGGAGWNCTPEEFKKGINTMAAMGINMFILHGFYYECEHQGSQSDWPTSFFCQNPYWKYFKQFSIYTQRICFMNSIGNPVVRYGLLYPIELMDVHMADGVEDETGMDISNQFHKVLNSMVESQMDVDMVDAESLRRAEIREGRLCVGRQKFELLLLPEGVEMEKDLEEKLSVWQREGGGLVFYKTACKSGLPDLWSSCVLCQPEQAAAAAAGLVRPCVQVPEYGMEKIFVNHRTAEDTDYYFVCNSSDEKKAFHMMMRETQAPICLNIETGKTEAVLCEPAQDGISVSLALDAGEAVYLVFGAAAHAGGRKAEGGGRKKTLQEEWVTGKWEFLPLSSEYDERWSPEAGETELEIPVAGLATDLSDDYQEIRICDCQGQPGRAARHVSLWKASWITRRISWNDQLDASDLYFCKQIAIDGEIQAARFCIAAVDSFEVYINGKPAAEGESHGEPAAFDCEDMLRTGDNLISVHVKNHKPLHDVYVCSAEVLPKDRFISLLLQGTVRTEKGEQLIVSDESWLVTDSREAGWNQDWAGIQKKTTKVDVQKIKNFNQPGAVYGWVRAWERGRPPLKPWGDLPLWGRRAEYPINLYYAVTIPAGAGRIVKPETAGNTVCFLDGKEISWEYGEKVLEKNDRVHTLTIRVRAENEDGGLLKPVRVLMKPNRVNLMDWSRWGLEWFSGRCRYTNTFSVKPGGNRYMLDLGDVNFCAEIWINQRLAAVKLWPPYRADITEFLRDGENEITIIAANLAGNQRRHMLVDDGMALGWNRYWNEDNMDRDSQNYVSGLLGPVRLIETKTES